MSNNYYSKQYTGNKIITWKNFTDTSTPLSAANLQKSHSAINDVDNEVFAAFQLVDQTKLDKADVQNMISSVQYNQNTGTFVFTLFSGSTLTFDTNLEKIVVNFSYNQLTQKLELTQSDGTVVEVDLSAFVANPDLQDSDEIGWTINANGQISAYIKNNSITDVKMQPNYLADITEQAGNAEASAETAEYNAKLSQSYANGTSNLSDRPNEGTDNAKYYSEQSSDYSEISQAWAEGKKGNTDVPNTDPQYHNNAKYWAEQAEQHATDMTGATATTDGTHGLIPKPLAGDNEKFFSGDGTYKKIPQTSASIADTETSPATHAHSVDEQFFYNDILYTVISAISIGDSLIVGTNIQTSATIVDQLGDHRGHVIKNSSGISLTDRTALQFENGYVEDDGTNDKTIVKSTNFIGTQAEWNALSLTEQAKYTSKDIIDDVSVDADLFKVVDGKLCIGYYVVIE